METHNCPINKVNSLNIGIDDVSSTEDFDFLWDSWNDLVFAALNTYVP